MKVWLISLAGLIVFVFGSLYVQHFIGLNTNRLDRGLETAETELEKNQWEKSLQDLESIKKSWQKIKPIWAVLLHHQEIDAIDQALVKTMKAVAGRNYSEAKIELGSLRHYLKHIPERVNLSLTNVF